MRNKLRTIIKLIAASCVMAQSLAAAFTDAVDNQDGTFTNWFGTFTPEDGTLNDREWIKHDEHGHLFIWSVGNGIWAYDPNAEAAGIGLGGWIFTSENLFPSFYVGAGWAIYIEGVQGPPATPRVFWSHVLRDSLFLPKATTDTIVGVASGNENFSSLVTAVVTADLVEALSSEGPFTVFAPDNAAFAKLDPTTLNDLLTNPESKGALTDILTYHVIPGRLPSSQLGLDLGAILKGEYISGYVETLGGADIRIDVTPFGILLNGDTMVTSPDIETSNGIIHVIDNVLLPPADIVDTAVAAGFSTLVAAVQAAGLEGALRGEGPYTVFAPTDEAFAALGQETIDFLLMPENVNTLADILLYHVFEGEVYASDAPMGVINMLNTDPATIDMNEFGMLTINGVNIVVTDVPASNGVIHVIDTVILPPAEQ